jgi:hypothetical protein
MDIDSPVTLILAVPTNSDDLRYPFLQYDTEYSKGDESMFYRVERGKSLVLLLFKDSQGRIFSTVRMRYGVGSFFRKVDELGLYQSQIGNFFTVVKEWDYEKQD